MAEENLYDKLRQQCWDKAHDGIGYAFIFSNRMSKMRKRIKALTAFGIVVPVSAALVVYSYTHNEDIVKYTVAIATPLTIIQFLLSLTSIIYRWDDTLSYSIEATGAHSTLSEKFRKLGRIPPSSIDELQKSYDMLEVEFNERSKQDSKEGLKSWELRMGMRAGLRELGRKCVGCNSKPLSLENTECHVCGNYSFKYKILNK